MFGVNRGPGRFVARSFYLEGGWIGDGWPATHGQGNPLLLPSVVRFPLQITHKGWTAGTPEDVGADRLPALVAEGSQFLHLVHEISCTVVV